MCTALRPRPRLLAALAAVCALAYPPAARALDFGGISLNGFGSLADGLSNRNVYLAADTKGTSAQSGLALAISSHPVERLNVFGQIRAQGTGMDLSMNLDWAFAEWTFYDALKLRAGRCKLPLGFYSEIRDVGTLRPFLFIPQSVYGLLEMSADAYNGLGLTGGTHAASGWGLDYDVFAGDVSASLNAASENARENGQSPPPAPGTETGSSGSTSTDLSLSEKIVGLRLILSTPVEGLRFFAAGYYGSEDSSTNKILVGGAGGELLYDKLSVRLEGFAVHTSEQDTSSMGAYLELAYHLLPELQVAARGELARIVLGTQATGDTTFDSLLRHSEAALGLNYWFSPQLVLKLSFHYIDGNLFAQPADLTAALNAGTLNATTLLFNLGAQFSF